MASTAAILLAIATTACGRLHFDDRQDALTGHDEDGDGIPDIIDPCPHIPGDRADADGDGVGDACDPNPNNPIDHWLSFSTLQPGDQPFDDASAFTQEADSLHLVGNAQPTITRAFGTIRVDIGYDINGLTGDPQHQVGAGIDNPASLEFYFGELNSNMGAGDVAVVRYDNATGYTQLDTRVLPMFHTGSGYFRLDCVAGAAPAHHLVTGWFGELYNADAATPGYRGGADLRVALNGVDIQLRYVALIATQ